MKILIGKFTDQELTDELYYENQLYFNWFLSFDNFNVKDIEIRNNIKEIKNFCKNKPYIFDFGRHKGRTLKYVFDNDINYYNYIKSQALKSYESFKSTFLIDVIEKFENKHK